MNSFYRSPKVELYLEISIESWDIIPDVLLLMSEWRRDETDESDMSESVKKITLCQKVIVIKARKRALKYDFVLSCTFSDFPELLVFLSKAPSGSNA